MDLQKEEMEVVRTIDFGGGKVLEVEMVPSLANRIRQLYGLSEGQQLEDSHIRTYLCEAINNAINKAERELKDAGAVEGVPRTDR